MISIIIPTLNDKSNLMNLLEDIKRQTSHSFEVICIDGGSTDDTLKLAQSYGARCIIEPKKNSSNGILCSNIGATHSIGKILFFTASDVRISNDTISILNSEFRNPNLIAITGRAIPYDCNTVCKIEYSIYYLIASLLSRTRFVSSGSFLAVRKSAFLRASGFPFTYNSDGNLGATLHKIGQTKFKHDLTYQVSARRYTRYGFLRFNREYLYTIENFIPQLNINRLGAIHVKSPSH